MIRKILLLFIPLILASCGQDEPELFHLTLGTEGDAELGMGDHSAEITINGYSRWIEVGIIGDFDSYKLSDDMPDWLTITASAMPDHPHYFRIIVSELSGSDSRYAKISFTVFKGSRSESGWISIAQNPCSLADLQKTERRAMKNFLSKFDVVDELPAISDIRVGSVAPFYKLDADGMVYMQVVKMGAGPVATEGERICFRFLRYNLLYYLENGVLPNGVGNANDLSQGPAFFELGSDSPSTTQWGSAIQMPMRLELPVDSEVNLVVASEAGLTSEISNVTPFLYNIRYFASTI